MLISIFQESDSRRWHSAAELEFPQLLAPSAAATATVPFPTFLARHMTARFEDYMRVVEQRRLSLMNRGASQETIERNTFPHKYKQVLSLSLFLFIFFC